MKDVHYPQDPGRLLPTRLNGSRMSSFGNTHNGHVGEKLLSQTDKVRVWYILLAPGQRLPVHKHVLNYFWTRDVPWPSRPPPPP